MSMWKWFKIEEPRVFAWIGPGSTVRWISSAVPFLFESYGTLDCGWGGFVLVSRTLGNSTGLENRADLVIRDALFVYVFRLTGLRCRKTVTVDTRDLGDKMSRRGVAIPPHQESEGRRQSLDLS